MVVVCNKADRAVASPPAYVRTRLEKELTAVREARGRGDGLAEAGDTSGTRRRAAAANVPRSKFSFDECEAPVTFVTTSAVQGDTGALRAALT